MNNVNANIWGDPWIEYDGMNNRTGATDIDDPDFDDFPPFVKNNMAALGSNPSSGLLTDDAIYLGVVNAPEYFDYKEPIDLSIAYVSCINPDLFICNLGIPVTLPTTPYNADVPPSDAFAFRSKPEKGMPITFMDIRPFGCKTNNPSASSIFNNPYYMVPNRANIQFVPAGENTGNLSSQTNINNSNNNLFYSYWRDFGVRSLFGTIKVIYFDNTYNATTGIPQNTVKNSLHWYESQTDEWKSDHRILAAFLTLNFRRSTSGLYNDSTPSQHGMFADLSNQIFADPDVFGTTYRPQQWQPQSIYTKNSGSYLSLFGVVNAGNTTLSSNTFGAVWATQQSNGGTCSQSNILVGINADEGTGVYLGHGNPNNSNGRRWYWVEMEGTDDNLERLRKTAAAYGLFFTDGMANETGYADLYAAGHDEDRWINEKMCLGVVDKNGFTDGTYTRGTNNPDANNWTWRTASESKYDPDKPPPSPDNQYSRQTIFNHIGDLASLTKRYVLSGSFVELLGEQLYNITYTLTDQDQDYTELENKIKSEFLVTNPIDCIIDLRRYPMQIPSEPDLVHLMLGRYDTGLNVYELARPCQTYLFELLSPIYPLFGDSFLDYSPWTSFELYVPFCGTVRLNPEDILGNRLAVQLVVDFTTGTCTGFIQSDNLVIETVTGTLGIDIPVSGIQAVTTASQLNNAILNKKEAKTSQIFQALNIVKGASNPIGYIEGIIQKGTETQRADYNLQHTEAPVHVIGTSSPLTSWAIDLNCRLICYYPTSEEMFYIQNHVPKLSEAMLERYGHIEGFATVEVNAIGSHTGLIIATDVNTQGISCTDEEREMIKSALSEGCYV